MKHIKKTLLFLAILSLSQTSVFARDYGQNKQSCHPATKIVTNHYGHSKNVGGTMCYDRHGDAYIVKGSRYNLH